MASSKLAESGTRPLHAVLTSMGFSQVQSNHGLMHLHLPSESLFTEWFLIGGLNEHVSPNIQYEDETILTKVHIGT